MGRRKDVRRGEKKDVFWGARFRGVKLLSREYKKRIMIKI